MFDTLRKEIALMKELLDDLEFSINGAEQALRDGNREVNLAKLKAKKSII
jgi:hypothetical protein